MDDGHTGISVDDLPAIYRQGYLHAIESARAEHDPGTDWDGFREYLWEALIRVFGLDVPDRWPEQVTSAGSVYRPGDTD